LLLQATLIERETSNHINSDDLESVSTSCSDYRPLKMRVFHRVMPHISTDSMSSGPSLMAECSCAFSLTWVPGAVSR